MLGRGRQGADGGGRPDRPPDLQQRRADHLEPGAELHVQPVRQPDGVRPDRARARERVSRKDGAGGSRREPAPSPPGEDERVLRYMVRRTIFLVLVLITVSLFTFVVFVKMPAGDPIA